MDTKLMASIMVFCFCSMVAIIGWQYQETNRKAFELGYYKAYEYESHGNTGWTKVK